MNGPTVANSILIGSLMISISILISSGAISIKGFTPQKVAFSTQASPAPTSLDNQTAPDGITKVSVDDDPVFGDKNAPITMVEFSDYECPFCKRYFTQTLPDIKKNYVDTGKMKIVYRDLPLEFHTNAHKEAEAADCARDQGGDSVYFKFHDEIFKRTTSNGTGLSLDQLPVIAKDLGLDGNLLQQCLDSGKYKQEVDKDLADAQAAGANGTPTFFIGKSSSSGVIDGVRIVGAQPFSAFKTVIDQQLSK